MDTCALLRDGSVKCWGDNAYGELGDGTTTSSHTPVSVKGISGAIAISAGENDVATCAVLRDGGVKCWGGYAGTTTDSLTPVSVYGISDAVAISASAAHTCAVLRDGSVKCWGQDVFYDGTDYPTPVSVSGL